MDYKNVLVLPQILKMPNKIQSTNKLYKYFTYEKKTAIYFSKPLFVNLAGLIKPCSVHFSAKNNCVILTNGPRPKGAIFAMLGGKALNIKLLLPDSYIPLPSIATEITDVYYNSAGLLIFRWPVWMYNKSITTPSDDRRLISRQLRESKSIEETFKPLGNRPKPYPFFIPTLPLDPLWPPAVDPDLADKHD